MSRVGGRAWRSRMRSWLLLLGVFKSARGLPRTDELRRGVALQLMEDDPQLQVAALKCLKVICFLKRSAIGSLYERDRGLVRASISSGGASSKEWRC